MSDRDDPYLPAWPEPDPTSDVELLLPGDAALIRVARLAAAAMASLWGFDLDGVDDVKIVVDEVCATLMELSDGSGVRLRFSRLVPDGIGIDAAAAVSGGATVDGARGELGGRILDVIADRHELSIDSGTARFRAMRRCDTAGDPAAEVPDTGGSDG